MKKNLVPILVLIITLLSCKGTKYTLDPDSTPYGVDFSEGKWLLNEIDSPLISEERSTKIVEKTLRPQLGNRLVHASEIKKTFTYLPIKPEKWKIEQVKNQTGFDYFINIKAQRIREEVGSLSTGEIYQKQKNVADAIIEIYNLNTGETIHYQRIVGSNGVDESDDDFLLMKDADMIALSCIRRLMKKLK
ncbi:hypothetical protein GTQ40_16230 [Flavobacteriaceae bacterium R38]|nr:hypothetical protein [Flavobacteriaceae bacterium R38]